MLNKIKIINFLTYLLLIIPLLLLDQSTKHHAEKKFLLYSGTTDVHNIKVDKERIFTFGNSPAKIIEQNNTNETPSNSWLDLHFTYLRNKGSIFGFLSWTNDSFRIPFFNTAYLLISLFLFYKLYNSLNETKYVKLFFAFVLAGALGNFYDRLLLQYVIDWINFHWKIFSWEVDFAVFNIADICIDIGIGCFFIDLFTNKKKNTNNSI